MQAWSFYDEVGESHYAASFLGACLSRCLLTIGLPDDDGHVGPAFDAEGNAIVEVNGRKVPGAERAGEALALIRALRSEIGGQPQMLRTMGINLTVAGEFHLVGSIKDPDSGIANYVEPTSAPPPLTDVAGLQWEVLSTEEFRPQGDDYVRRALPGATPKQIRGESVHAIRIWRSHPRWCADEATEILTKEGWKTCDDLMVGDEALTLDHETGESEWQAVEAVNVFDVQDEQMLSLQASTYSALTTLDHRWPVVALHTGVRKWKTSAELNQTDLLPRLARHKDLPTEPKYSDAFVELVAWYWTEGSRREANISQSHRVNPHHCDSIRACLTELFGVASIEDQRHGVRKNGDCTFEDCTWPVWARTLCKAHDAQRRYGSELRPIRRRSARPSQFEQPAAWREYRDEKKGMTSFYLNAAASGELLAIAPDRHVSLDFIQQLTRAQLELFIRRSVDADGHEREGVAVITQKDRTMLVPFEMACLLAGYSPRTVDVSTPKRKKWATTVAKRPYLHVGVLPERVSYSGRVWCPTTANKTWLARREGKPFFTGNSELPDSSMRPVMDILEELSLLTREVRGETLSRIPNGQLLLIPDEIEYPDDDGDDSMGEAGDPFTRDLINTMSTAITDKSSAAQTVPLIFRAPAELLKEVRTLDLRPNRPSDSMEKRSEAVRRFAQGVDLPVEIVLGHMSTSFANAVQIDDSLFKSHVEPVLEIICDALTAGYLRPAMGPDMPFVVHYDSSELVARPNRAQDAKDLHDRWALANASLRSAAGFSDSDAPDEEEVADRIRIQQLTHVRQTIPTTPQELQIEDQPSSVQPGSAPGAPIKQGPLDGNNTDKPLAASIQGAAEVATEAAIVRAGARLRTKAYKMDQVRAQLSQVPNAEVPVSLGPSLVERFSDGEDLFHGQFDPLWNCVVRWTGDQNYASALRDACMGIALRRMYQPRQPFPFHDLPDYEMRSVVAALDG